MDFDIFKNIKTFIFDVDGVFTDSTILINEEGDLLRTMSVRDGQAVKIALNYGYQIIVITKGASLGVKKRLLGLGIEKIFDKAESKISILNKLVNDGNIKLKESCYMGDDLPDIPVLEKVGLATCPKDAIPEVIQRAHFISSKNGGRGCVRELIEKVLKSQDNWNF